MRGGCGEDACRARGAGHRRGGGGRGGAVGGWRRRAARVRAGLRGRGRPLPGRARLGGSNRSPPPVRRRSTWPGACAGRRATPARSRAEGMRPWQVADALDDLVERMEAEDEAANRAIGAHGAALCPNVRASSRTATRAAWPPCSTARRWAWCTRPPAQGKVRSASTPTRRARSARASRLTAWELAARRRPRSRSSATTWRQAGHGRRASVDAVVVGADRIAANGDVANKIGTLRPGGARAPSRHIPFYVAAPASTVDAGHAPPARPSPSRSATAAEVLPQPHRGRRTCRTPPSTSRRPTWSPARSPSRERARRREEASPRSRKVDAHVPVVPVRAFLPVFRAVRIKPAAVHATVLETVI